MSNIHIRDTNIRIAQQKGDKSINITLPIDETEIYPGDSVNFEVVDKGKVVLTKIKNGKAEKENVAISYLNKLLEKFGLHTHYEITKKDKINVVESTDTNEQKNNFQSS